MQKVTSYLALALMFTAVAEALETCSNNAQARSSTYSAEKEWVGNHSNAWTLQDKVTELCAMVPECKAQAEAQRAARLTHEKAEREAAAAPVKPRGPIPEQAEFKKRLGEINLIKEK